MGAELVLVTPRCCEDGYGAPGGVCARCEADNMALVGAYEEGDMKEIYVRPELRGRGYGGSTYYDDEDINVVLGSDGVERLVAHVTLKAVGLRTVFGDHEVRLWPSLAQPSGAMKLAVLAAVRDALTPETFLELLHETRRRAVIVGRNQLRKELTLKMAPEFEL